MIYKTLLRCCLINAIGFLASVITELYILNGSKNEFICNLFEISLSSPHFIVQSLMLQISIFRCIMRCSKKNAEEGINFQNTVAAFMIPLPFAYLGTFYIIRLANDKSVGPGHLVSIKVIIKDDIFVATIPKPPICVGRYLINKQNISKAIRVEFFIYNIKICK